MDFFDRINFQFVFVLWILIIVLGVVSIIFGILQKDNAIINFTSIFVAFTISFIFPVIYSIKKSEKIVFENNTIPIKPVFTEPFHSIIIANSTRRNKQIGIFVGIDMIIDKIKSQNCKYKITLCNTPDEVKNEIENPNAEYVYLFGHGFKGGLTFYHTDSILKFYYRTIDPKSIKKFIGQLHCNSGDEISLIELLLKNNLDKTNYYFQQGLTTTFILWYEIRFKVLNKIKKCNSISSTRPLPHLH